MSRTHTLALLLAVAALAAPTQATAATAAPADVGVYAEQPSTFRDDVTAFPPSGSIFDYRFEADDPLTRLEFTAVPGFKNGRGRFLWRIATLGKYVLLGNAQSNSGLGGTSTDLRIGIFDSETKQFCNLIIDPTLPLDAPQLVTGNPGARQSRILFATTPSFAGAAFGYIAADLDNPNPCTWPATLASAGQLNAGFLPGDQLCPNNLCIFDSVALLGHEDVAGDPFGRDYVFVGEYFGHRNAVVRVDGSGIAVAATYNVPMVTVPNVGGQCYSGGAARLPATDFRLPDTRPANDWRFLVSYDAFPVEVYPTAPPPECAQPYPYCPRDVGPDGVAGADCPATQACVQKYCTAPFVGIYTPCTSDAQCGTRGPCTSACLQKSPLYTCKTANGGGSHRQCLRSQNPSTCPNGETCSNNGAPLVIGPSQEYSFDKTTNTITHKSPRFLSTYTAGANGPSPTMAVYDNDRTAWVGAEGRTVGLYRTKSSSDNCTVGTQTNVHVPSGEHCFYDTADPGMAVVVPPDQKLTTEQSPAYVFLPRTLQVGSAMYMADNNSLQYSQQYLGAWFPPSPATYKVGFPYLPANFPITDPLASSSLPAEPRRCSISLRGCDTDADCAPSGGGCTALAENALGMLDGVPYLEAGGAPRSLWIPSYYSPTAVQPGKTVADPVPQTDGFLLRVPVGFNLDDNLSLVRASVAWSGNRLWLVAEHNGELKYRVRDAGVWSGWYSLAPHNITTAGGPAVIANGTNVFVFARSTAGLVYLKVLTSAQTCVPGSCAWSSWGALPSTVTTNDDITATFAAGLPLVVVRSAANEGVYATLFGFGWLPWTRIDTALTTGVTPAVSYHAADARAWIVARRKSDGQLVSSRLDPLTFAYDPWAALPTSGGPVSNGPPGIVSDGTKVRVFTFEQAFPNFTWQVANDGSGWSGWRRLVSFAGTTRQPAAASVNGDVDLLTNWVLNGTQQSGLQETFVP